MRRRVSRFEKATGVEAFVGPRDQVPPGRSFFPRSGARSRPPDYMTRMGGRYIVEDIGAPGGSAKRIAFESDDLEEAISYAKHENTVGGVPRRLRVTDRLDRGAQKWPPAPKS